MEGHSIGEKPIIVYNFKCVIKKREIIIKSTAL